MSRTYRLSIVERRKRAARMKALHADPAFNRLAGMSSHQKNVYQKLIRCGIETDRALHEARLTA